jgi:tetratricopeptide (TPR) repeat protein
MEAGMTRKVKSKKSIEWFAFCLFTFALLFSYPLLVGGCNGQKADVAGVEGVQETSAEKRKAELLKLLDRKFENPEAHFELGQLYQAERLWSKAEYHYNVALSFEPVHREAQAAMVKVYLDSGDKAKSKTYADIYMSQVVGSASGLLRLGLGFQKQQLDEYALSCYQQALQLAPNSARIHKHIGYYYLNKDDKVRAKEYFIRSFQLDPRQPDVAGELGRLGVEVRIPQKTEMQTEEPDEIVE